MRSRSSYKVIIILYLVALLPVVCLRAQNFTNKGKEFWVGYGHNHLFTLTNVLNSQEMVIYMSAGQPAHVTISVAGTTWTRQYSIPANTVVPSDLLPKSGPDDCRLLTEGLSAHGIHIESDVPIVAYAHVYGQNSSGAAMLLPVESYGYTYYSLNTEQNYDATCYSWFYVAASENNTRVRITPSKATVGGKPAGTPFDVVLNKGQLYNVMGLTQSSGVGNDMSGSKIQSIPGSDGICHPIGVFSGSSRTTVCNLAFGGGDFMMQQVFPVSAWGSSYLTALTSSTVSPSTLNNNKFRVYIKEPGTQVRRNGTLLSGITNNSFYEFLSMSADYITANKPIMVAQIIPSSGGCGTVGDGDPEMFYLSPMEQAINNVSFYNTNKENISTNYLTLIIPQSGMGSLLIDGVATWDYTYPHPNLAGYQVVVKQLPATPMQHTAQSNAGFTAITYGLGPVETYGYNAGCYVNNLTTIPSIQNTQGQTAQPYTCAGTPFHIFLQSIYQPNSIVWHFSRVSNISPAADVTSNNPVPSGSTVINGKTYYTYTLPQDCLLGAAATGIVSIPVSIYDPSIDNCSQSEELTIEVPVKPGPDASFTTADVCASDSAHFINTSSGPGIDRLYWNFGDGGIDSIPNIAHRYQSSGAFTVQLQTIRNSDGCFGNASQTIHINPVPIAAFALPAVVCMPGGVSAFTNQSVLSAGSIGYQWKFGDGATATDKDPVHTYAAAATYPVQLIAASQLGCADTLIKSLSAFAQKPVAWFIPPTDELCQNSVQTFKDSSYTVPAGGSITAWHWWWGDGAQSASQDPAKSYLRAGSYPVQLTVESAEGCWSDTIQQTIQVYGIPQVSAGSGFTTELNHPVTLQGSVNDPSAAIQWSPPAYLSNPGILRPQAMPPATQWYYLTATDAHHCSSTDSVQVKIFKELKIPNAFSPNGDGHNDKWLIPGLAEYTQARVDVFNRWGQLVYHSTGYSNPWDGSFKGGLLPTGAYYYVIAPNGGGYGKISGSVLILR